MKLVTASVLGEAADVPKAYFKIWHGLVPALFLSVVAVVGGLLLLAVFNPLAAPVGDDTAARSKGDLRRHRRGGGRLARKLILPLHNGAFSRYAAIGSIAIVAAGFHAWTTGTVGAPTRELQAAGPVPIAGWLMLVAATAGWCSCIATAFCR